MSKLEQFCLNITDGEHASVMDDPCGEYYLLSNKNLINGEIIVSPTDRRISFQTFRKIDQRTKLEPGDVLVSTVGTIGKTAVVGSKIKYAFQRSVGIIKTDKAVLNPHFLKYKLNSPQYQKLLERISKGAVQKCLFISDLANLEIDVPDINRQMRIVNILKAIDDKIANNNAINAELEAMAKTIYDYWFLQFEFPDENGKPYKSSGGKMVYNEELKRDIPADWEVKKLGDLLHKNHTQFDYKTVQPTIDLSVMPTDSMALDQINSSAEFSTNLFCMREGDILFGAIRPYLKKAGIAPCNGVVAGTVHSYRPISACDYNFALITMCRNDFFEYANKVAAGTKMPVVSSDSLMEYKVPYNLEIVTRFNSIAIKEIICSKIQENQELASLRDFLLPLLMNGQVGFKEEN